MVKKILGLCVILVLLFTACKRQSVTNKPEGIYLDLLHRGYILIDRDNKRHLEVKETNFLTDDSYLKDAKWDVSFKRKKLKLTTDETSTHDSSMHHGYIYELQPSSTTPGDWDLISISETVQPISNTIRSKNDLSPIKPVPSFLHRIDDKRIIEYFKLLPSQNKRGDSDNNPQFLKIASELHIGYPDDIFIKMLYLDSLIWNCDTEGLKKEIEDLEKISSTSKDLLSQYALTCAKNSLHSIELSAVNQNAYDLMEKVFSPDVDLPTRLKLFPDMLQYNEFAIPNTSVIRTSRTYFLDYQTMAKVFRNEAIFLMLQGKREEALSLIASVYQLGKFLNQTDSIGRLMAIATRAITTNGLEIYALNCCETPKDFQHLWKTLENINSGLKESDFVKPHFVEYPFESYFTSQYTEYVRTHLIYYHTTEAHLELVRMATAAKYRFITQGTFPKAPEEFAPLLTNGLPKDSFSSESLKFISNPDEFTCYSIGPNKQDNFANIIYDSTNGTVSSGDIILKVPSQREYPFPKNGVRASTRDELLKQFPNKLPYDPFANRRNVSLKITNTTPVYVFSVGPDTNQFEVIDDSYVPKVHYDPTNGTTSAGDLFITIPKK